jgi:hypothetical protein
MNSKEANTGQQQVLLTKLSDAAIGLSLEQKDEQVFDFSSIQMIMTACYSLLAILLVQVF